METEHPILSKTITVLDVSLEFKNMCNENDFLILKDITTCSISELLKKRGFSMHVMMELVDLLEKHGLKDSLQEK